MDSLPIAEDSPSAFFDFLDLPNCVTLQRDNLEHMLLVRAKCQRFPKACPRCPALCLRSEPPRKLVFWDVPHLGRPTLVQLFVSDATCLACGKLVKTELEWLHPARDMTIRLVKFILARMATQSTITQVALDTGQDVQTVIDIFMDAFREWDSKRGMALPSEPGIDEAHFPRKVIRTVIVDSKGSLGTVDVLEDRQNATIAKRLRAAPNAKDIGEMTMDFTGPFRDAATKPADTVSSSNRSTSEDDEPSEASTFDTALFGKLPQVDLTAGGHDEYILEHPEEVAPPLPNMEAVADHFHFGKYIVAGFRATWSFVRSSLEDLLFQAEMAKLSETVICQIGREAAESHVREKVAENLGKVKAALWQHRYALSAGDKKRAKQSAQERMEIDALLDALPLLRSGWEAKNAGLNIFPHKRPPSRSKRARMAANTEQPVAKPVAKVDVQQVEKKLDAWVRWVSADEQLKAFFEDALKVIPEWRPELLRIASTGLNNARAETKVALLRTFERNARGHKFNLLRARQLWFDAFRRTNRWPRFCDTIDGRVTTIRLIEVVDVMEATGQTAPATTLTDRSDACSKSPHPMESKADQRQDHGDSTEIGESTEQKTPPNGPIGEKHS